MSSNGREENMMKQTTFKIKPMQLRKDEVYYWSPLVHWQVRDQIVVIGDYQNEDVSPELFATLYNMAQKGVSLTDVLNTLQDVHEEIIIHQLMKDLIQRHILVNRLLSPRELFESQTQLLEQVDDPDVFLDPEKFKHFKINKLNRGFEGAVDKKIPMADPEFPTFITQRRSQREFQTNKKVSLFVFAQVLGAFRQTDGDLEFPTYYYPSAGGLYPIDVFVYVKDNRVDEVPGGLYYYHPVDNELKLVSSTCVITKHVHHPLNQECFETSAFTLFFIYNAQVSMPKYGGMGYYFGCLDTGIMTQLFTTAAEMNDLGVCSIGEMHFDKVKKYFKLSSHHVFLHSLEAGLKKS